MPVEFKDYYSTLGVARAASAEDIKRAFRKLAREHHPDVAKDKKAAEEKFKEINEAYEVLSDPEKRKKYDTLGQNWKQGAGFEPPPGWQQYARPGQGAGGGQEFHFDGTGFSDFFEQFFGGGRGFGSAEDLFGGARGGRAGRAQQFTEPNTPLRGNDVEGDILVTLEEAMRGSIRPVTLQQVNPRTGETETRTFKVRIPPGVHEGRVIRVPGKGQEGFHGGSPGDLYLHVRLAAHPDFRVLGADLYYDLPLAPWEAVLGTTARVPTLDGTVTVRIPANTDNGRQLRVRNRGLPKAADGERGDLYVVAQVVLPPQLSDEERALWEKLRQTSRFNPREIA